MLLVLLYATVIRGLLLLHDGCSAHCEPPRLALLPLAAIARGGATTTVSQLGAKSTRSFNGLGQGSPTSHDNNVSRGRGTLTKAVTRTTTVPIPPLSESRSVTKTHFSLATSRLRVRWFALPKVPRYFVSGNLGNICFYLLEQSIGGILHEQPELLPDSFLVSKHTLSFIMAYLLQVVPQHLLHALLVYGLDTINTPNKYFTTLAGTYSAFAFAMVGSTILNGILIRFLNKATAFVSTITVFSLINYFFISWIVQKASRASTPITKSKNL